MPVTITGDLWRSMEDYERYIHELGANGVCYRIQEDGIWRYLSVEEFEEIELLDDTPLTED